MPIEDKIAESVPEEDHYGGDDQFEDDQFDNEESYGGDDAFDSNMEKQSSIKDSIKNSVKEDTGFQISEENLQGDSGQVNEKVGESEDFANMDSDNGNQEEDPFEKEQEDIKTKPLAGSNRGHG